MYRLILSVHFICSIRSVHLCHSDLCTVNYKKSPSELVYRKLLESYQLPKLPAHAFIKGPKQIHQKALLQELKQSQPSGPRSIRGCLSWLNAVAIGKFASASGKWINIKVWESGCRLNTCTVQVFFFIFFQHAGWERTIHVLIFGLYVRLAWTNHSLWLWRVITSERHAYLNISQQQFN